MKFPLPAPAGSKWILTVAAYEIPSNAEIPAVSQLITGVFRPAGVSVAAETHFHFHHMFALSV